MATTHATQYRPHAATVVDAYAGWVADWDGEEEPAPHARDCRCSGCRYY